MERIIKENEEFKGVTESRAFSLAKSFSYQAGKLLAIVLLEVDSVEIIEIATENNAKYTFPFQHVKFGRRGSYKKYRGSVTEIRLNRYKFLPKLTPEEFAFVKSWFVKTENDSNSYWLSFIINRIEEDYGYQIDVDIKGDYENNLAFIIRWR